MKSLRTKTLLYNEFHKLWYQISVEKKEYKDNLKSMYIRMRKFNLI